MSSEKSVIPVIAAKIKDLWHFYRKIDAKHAYCFGLDFWVEYRSFWLPKVINWFISLDINYFGVSYSVAWLTDIHRFFGRTLQLG